MQNHPSHQRGAVLAVSLIFLAILMLVAAAVRMTMTNTRIAGNMQTAIEAQAAAQNAIDVVISQDMSVVPPQQIINSSAVSNNGAGYSTTVAVQCIASTTVTPAQIHAVGPTSSCAGSAGSASICLNAVWNVRAVTTTASTPNHAAEINQGVGQLALAGGGCDRAAAVPPKS